MAGSSWDFSGVRAGGCKLPLLRSVTADQVVKDIWSITEDTCPRSRRERAQRVLSDLPQANFVECDIKDKASVLAAIEGESLVLIFSQKKPLSCNRSVSLKK